MTTSTGRARDASRKRRQQQKDDLRRAILDAAAELFDERGHEGFSLRKVAERIGYSATTIYLYYADKDALLAAVIDEAFARFLSRLSAAAARPGLGPLERIDRLGRSYVAYGLEHPVQYRLMFMQRSDLLLRASEGPGSPPRIASFRVLEEAVQTALDAGALRPGDARAYANLLWAGVHGITALAISMPGLCDPGFVDQALEQFREVVARGLATAQAKGTP